MNLAGKALNTTAFAVTAHLHPVNGIDRLTIASRPACS